MKIPLAYPCLVMSILASLYLAISDDIMFRKLQELDVSTSPGPDGWH